MPLTRREFLYGWGHTPVEECVSYRPEKIRDLSAILGDHTGALIARGMGRSYGDASLQPAGVIRTERFNHFIEFDTREGTVRAQGGVTLSELMELAIPRGWFPPVIPGTRHVTLAGAFACNIHGKNHWKDGDFAEHVLSIKIMLPGGEAVECSALANSDLFWATAGGMGMTGVIEEVTLRLKPIESTSLKTLSYRVDSIEDMVAAFEHYRESADYMVGWIDHMGKGDEAGRGVFEAANHIAVSGGGKPLSQFAPARARFSVPFFTPSMLLNRYSMALYNRYRFKKYSHDRASDIVDFSGFFHPLDGIGQWNRLYGGRGFFQYQCLIPETPDAAGNLRALLAALHKQRLISFLAVIKYHRDGKGYLTFPKAGYSLALDFPNTRRVRKLLPQIDRWVADHGGRIYLAKDALLAPEIFRAMYGEQADDWLELIRGIDPGARFTSLMSERLQWKSAP